MPMFSTPERRAEFFAKLEVLIGEYPEITTADPGVDDILDGFDPESPRVMNSLIVLATWTDMKDWSTHLYLVAPGVNHYMVRGVADAFLEWSRR